MVNYEPAAMVGYSLHGWISGRGIGAGYGKADLVTLIIGGQADRIRAERGSSDGIEGIAGHWI